MSRTIRRTNTSKGTGYRLALLKNTLVEEERFNRVLVEMDICRKDPDHWKWMSPYYQQCTLHCLTYQQYVNKKTAKFRGDSRSGKYSPPKWWRTQFCNKPLRRGHKTQLHTTLRQDDAWDGLSLIPYRNEKKWWYW